MVHGPTDLWRKEQNTNIAVKLRGLKVFWGCDIRQQKRWWRAEEGASNVDDWNTHPLFHSLL